MLEGKEGASEDELIYEFSTWQCTSWWLQNPAMKNVQRGVGRHESVFICVVCC